MMPLYERSWPIDEKTCRPPERWYGWPEKKKFALILTHDVEEKAGIERCKNIVDVEENLGFKSCLFFVPDRSPVPDELRNKLVRRGFEVGVHGLKHDGKLYSSKAIFQSRAVRINRYIKEWNSVGFRSPSMHHNLNWLCDLDIEYDASTFDTDPFEPQPEGVKTIFPFIVQGMNKEKKYVELPYTLPQDITLFIMMREKNIDLWKKKLDWIAEHGGLALLITHPDYMRFDSNRVAFDEYPARFYEEFLKYIKSKYEGLYWNALPRDIARFWMKNMSNVK